MSTEKAAKKRVRRDCRHELDRIYTAYYRHQLSTLEKKEKVQQTLDKFAKKWANIQELAKRPDSSI